MGSDPARRPGGTGGRAPAGGSGITNQVLTAHQGFWIAGNGTLPTNGSCSNLFADVKLDL
ncbi:MAG: hypothetical protein ACJ76Y_14810 [Thermoanaerobaculia bacterium]